MQGPDRRGEAYFADFPFSAGRLGGDLDHRAGTADSGGGGERRKGKGKRRAGAEAAAAERLELARRGVPSEYHVTKTTADALQHKIDVLITQNKAVRAKYGSDFVARRPAARVREAETVMMVQLLKVVNEIQVSQFGVKVAS